MNAERTHQSAVPDAVALDRYCQAMASRRSCRAFLPDPVDRAIIQAAVRVAASSPSGANKQPWTFVAVSDPDTKHRIRMQAEEVERRFYAAIASDTWLGDLAPLGTSWRKPFLEEAPWLIAVFAQTSRTGPDGVRERHYYVRESVGIAVGFLLSALHHAGLATLTYTPSGMGFLREILDRPDAERAYMLIVTGLRDPTCPLPSVPKRPDDEVLLFR